MGRDARLSTARHRFATRVDKPKAAASRLLRDLFTSTLSPVRLAAQAFRIRRIETAGIHVGASYRGRSRAFFATTDGQFLIPQRLRNHRIITPTMQSLPTLWVVAWG